MHFHDDPMDVDFCWTVGVSQVPPPSRGLLVASANSALIAQGRKQKNTQRDRGPSTDVARYNVNFQKNLVSIDQLGSSMVAELSDEGHQHGGRVPGQPGNPRVSQCLEGISNAIASLGGAMAQVHHSHAAFIASGEIRGIENSERWRKNNKLPRKSIKSPPTKSPKEVAHLSDDVGQRSIRRLSNSDDIGVDIETSDSLAYHLSKAQQTAMKRFIDIDEGRADRNSVFRQIPNNSHRVMAKVEFYRERSDLVLPRIEDQFMKEDVQSGSPIVDICRLNMLESDRNSSKGSVIASARGPRKRPMTQNWQRGCQTARAFYPSSSSSSHLPVAEYGKSSALVECGLAPISERRHYLLTADLGKGEANSMMGASTLSHVSSKLTLSPSASLESLQRRAEYFAELGQIRDLHIEHVRDTAREQAKTWRHTVLDEIEKKASRKDVANRHRTLFTWVMLAMGTRAMVRNWQSFLTVYRQMKEAAEKEETSLVREGSRRIRFFDEDAHLAGIVDHLPIHCRKVVVRAVTKSWSREVSRKCSQHAFRNWCHVLRLVRFCVILLRRVRLNHYAEMIKHCIEACWRGYRIRASMKIYLQQVKLLQNGMRACVKLRRHIRTFIFLPMVWEAETYILGEIIGMPQLALEREIDVHRAIWDPRARMLEAQSLSNRRFNWTSKEFVPGRRTKERIELRKFDIVGGRRKSVKLAKPTPNLPPKGNESLQSNRRRVALQDIQKAGLSAMQNRTPHPMMKLIDKYRLPHDLRESVGKALLRESTERWYIKYQDYGHDLIAFRKTWHRWRLDVAALGPSNRHLWPPVPLFPAYPCELMKVDQQTLRAKVTLYLKQTQAGQLL